MVLGIQTIETGVFGGIVTGILTAYLHNKFNKIELPAYLGFFSGSRFVPIITAVSSIFLGVIMFCLANSTELDFNAGGLVEKTGAIGTFFFGFILRLLGPFGLHHIFTYHFGKQDLGLIRSKWTYGTRYSKYLFSPIR